MSGYNGAGVFSYTYNWVNDAANGIPITASRMDTQFGDSTGGFNLAICRDGQSTIIGNIPFSGFRITGLGAATTVNDALTYAGAGNFAGLMGTTTNDSAVAGRVGEYVSANIVPGSAISINTGAANNVTSISLTAGDWDVQGNVAFVPAATTIVTSITGWVSSTSASTPSDANGVAKLAFTPGAANVNDTLIIATGTKRFSLAVTTTIYLSTLGTFTTSTMTSFGFIGARRVR